MKNPCCIRNCKYASVDVLVEVSPVGDARPFLNGGKEQEQARQSVVFRSISEGVSVRLFVFLVDMLLVELIVKAGTPTQSHLYALTDVGPVFHFDGRPIRP